MGVAKVGYTHQDMIDCIIAHPGISQGELAARYGYTQAWVSQVMASDAFKAALAARRAELVDPTLQLSIEERFRGMAELSLQRLMQKLEAPQVSDNVVLKAVELGAKALGVGGNAAPVQAVPVDHLSVLAERLRSLQQTVRVSMNKGVTDVEA